MLVLDCQVELTCVGIAVISNNYHAYSLGLYKAYIPHGPSVYLLHLENLLDKYFEQQTVDASEMLEVKHINEMTVKAPKFYHSHGLVTIVTDGV